jgi:hypothetical protein
VTTTPNIQPNTNLSAGNVNPPIIFEPTQELYPGLSGKQLWVVVSSSAANYGGAQVFVSTDGGASYNPAGPVLFGSATTGITTAEWLGASSPDSTNDLPVDLTESNGILQSFAPIVETNEQYPCYVEELNISLGVNGSAVASGNPITLGVNGTQLADLGTLGVNGTDLLTVGSDGFGYELMTYAVATLTGVNKFTLKATGGSNFLLRAIMNAPNSSSNGVAHAPGSRFALLSPSATGILKMNMPPVYVGQTIFFKILSFNSFGQALQSLSSVPAYSYVPTGVPGTV